MNSRVIESIESSDVFDKMVNFIPEKAIPFFFAIDNDKNCGYIKRPILIGVYYYPLETYLSINQPKKFNTYYTLTKNEYRFNVMELRHFLDLVSNNRYELGYYFQSPLQKWYVHAQASYSLPEIKDKIISYICNSNNLNPIKNYQELAKNLRGYLGTQTHKNPESLLSILRHLLVLERIIKFDLFPSSNINDLKHNHPLEDLIASILDINQNHEMVSYSLYLSFVSKVSELEASIQKLSKIKIDKVLPTYADLIQQGNFLFQKIIKI